jgi:hypothetical protein
MKRVAFVLAVTLGSIGVSFAQTQEEQQACMDDAFKFCGQAIPDRERVFYCLVQNKTAITPRCLAALTPFIPAEPPPRTAKLPKTKKKTASKDGAPINLNPR